MKELGPVLEDGFERLQLDMGLLVRSNKKRTMLNQQAVGGAKIPRPGDILICLRNNPPIFNGMRGILVSAEPIHDHWFKARIDFPDDGISLTTLINRHQFNQPKTISSIYELYEDFGYPRSVSDIGMLFDYGMAMTVHKAQGSAFESAVLWSEYWPSYDDGSDFFARWLYTGVTRAAKTLYLLR
jgi:exodeoxyribonuclease-5